MDWLIPTLLTGMATATATTFDDNIYLTLLFSKVNRTFRPRHVVVGEFFGFTILVGISLLGFLGGMVVSHVWIGLLGFLPIAIGVNALLSRPGHDSGLNSGPSSGLNSGSNSDRTVTMSVANLSHPHYRKIHRKIHRKVRCQSLWHTLRDRQTYQVSAVTLANGGNNIAIYIPLFASSTLPRLSIILSVCYAAVGLWLCLSYNLVRQPKLTLLMARYVRKAFPFVLIWLGASIVIENGSYQLLYAF